MYFDYCTLFSFLSHLGNFDFHYIDLYHVNSIEENTVSLVQHCCSIFVSDSYIGSMIVENLIKIVNRMSLHEDDEKDLFNLSIVEVPLELDSEL